MAGLFTHADCTPQHRVEAGHVLSLTNPVQENGTSLFRAVVYACVPVDARCDKLLLTAQSQLEVRFEPTTVDVRQSNAAWVEEWDERGERVRVKLKRPALIGAVHSSSYRKVALHRVDGEAVSEDPTVSGTTGGAFDEAFVSAIFEAAFSERIVNVRLGQAKSGDRSDESEKAKGKARAVRMSALSRLDLPGQPTAPRLRLLDPTETEVLWQWIEPGEQTIVSYSASGSDLVAALEPPVARVLSLERERAEEESGSASAASVNRLVLPLVVESDAPCRVILAQAHLEFLLSAEFLTAPADLSFDGSSRQTRAVGLPAVPTDPVRLDVEATFAFLAARATEEPELSDDSRFSGAVLEMGSGFAIPWEADRPYWLSGFAVGWYSLSETATLKLSLFPDAAGQIAARPIVEGGANVSLAGAGWARCTWTPMPLQPGRYWLKLSVGAGSGLWLGAAVAQPTTVWEQRPVSPASAKAMALGFLHHPLEPDGPAAALSPALGLTLNGVSIPVVAAEANAGALVGVLGSFPATVLGASEWTLEAASSNAIRVTLRSTRVTYRG